MKRGSFMKKAVRSVAAFGLAAALLFGTPEFVQTMGGVSFSTAHAATNTAPKAPKTSVKAGT